MNRRQVRDLTKAIRALSDGTRLRLVAILRVKGEQSVAELWKMIPVARATVSQHLRRLRIQDIVRRRRTGKSVVYSIDRGWLNRTRKAVEAVFPPK